jgi:FtsP/CotA-like multicopper oxidase with cupredoxin domain
VHWHGLRLENRYDGVPHETQAPIPVGGEFTYRIQFPDPGLYWYHPHIREDYTQDGKVAPFSPVETSYAAMGRFGNVFLTGGEPDLHLEAGAGEVVRLWLTNTANTRVFRVMLPGRG